MRALLGAFAAVQIAIGALLWLAPGFFFAEIGPYGPRNDHYMADLATFCHSRSVRLGLSTVRWAIESYSTTSRRPGWKRT